MCKGLNKFKRLNKIHFLYAAAQQDSWLVTCMVSYLKTSIIKHSMTKESGILLQLELLSFIAVKNNHLLLVFHLNEKTSLKCT